VHPHREVPTLDAADRAITDPQNREVRALHAVPFEEVTPDGARQGYRKWPLLTADPEILGCRSNQTTTTVHLLLISCAPVTLR
jgi:hypothetical protein